MRIAVRRRARAETGQIGITRFNQKMRRHNRQCIHNTLDTDSRRHGLLSSLCRDQFIYSVGIGDLIRMENEKI